MGKKILIAYFSRAGNNYVSGRIENLPVGNTEVAAMKIQELTGGELFKISQKHKYPEDYEECTQVAERELKMDARPELTNTLESIDDFETIILGYPNWWETMPMPVRTFLESLDFNGKTILPLCTHEGSGMGVSEQDIKKLCPGAKVLKGLAIQGGSVKNAGRDIESWLRANDLLFS